MDIKKIKENSKGITDYLKILRNKLFSKKIKIFYCSIIFFIILFGGIILGLFFSGFFGTLDNPSQKAIDILHSKEVIGLKETWMVIQGLREENLKIPLNYLYGKLSKPKKVFIDIAFEDLQKIEYKRELALNNQVLLASSEDYVPVKINSNSEEFDAKMRLKGDWVDHLRGNKWSFRIKITKGGALFGMKTFSIQDPRTRNNLNEWLYLSILKREGIIAPRYDFIEIYINGENKGIYALEEHFEKELIENNQRREGVILKFDEDPLWENRAKRINNLTYEEWMQYLSSDSLFWFKKSEIITFDNDKLLENPELLLQFDKAKNLLGLFREGKLKTSEVFDVEKTAKYFAINTLLGCSHAGDFENIRFYYNPITLKLEPIGFDGSCGREDVQNTLKGYLNYNQENPYLDDLIFNDEIFLEEYMLYLEKFSKKQYLDGIFNELKEELKEKINILHKDTPTYHFPEETFYENQNKIKESLTPVKELSIYLQKIDNEKKEIMFFIKNLGLFPLQILECEYEGIKIPIIGMKNNLYNRETLQNSSEFLFKAPFNLNLNQINLEELKVNYKILGLEKIHEEKILPWKYYIEENVSEQNNQTPEYLDVDYENSRIKIKKGNWDIENDLIIPPGFEVLCEGGTLLNLKKNSSIISYSNIQFRGSPENSIRIFSSDKTGEGLLVINANKTSNVKYVNFQDLSNIKKQGSLITGAITFYNSPVNFKNVIIQGMNSEDSLNLINSLFIFEESQIKNCASDCLDNDFSEGIIKKSFFIDCGNDCIDISGTKTNISDVTINNSGDKGISGGENCFLDIENVKIENSFIGIASKDKSNLRVQDSIISNVTYGLCVYQKKEEFGPSFLEIKNTSVENYLDKYLVEKESTLKSDGTIILANEKNIYKKIYEI